MLTPHDNKGLHLSPLVIWSFLYISLRKNRTLSMPGHILKWLTCSNQPPYILQIYFSISNEIQIKQAFSTTPNSTPKLMPIKGYWLQTKPQISPMHTQACMKVFIVLLVNVLMLLRMKDRLWITFIFLFINYFSCLSHPIPKIKNKNYSRIGYSILSSWTIVTILIFKILAGSDTQFMGRPMNNSKREANLCGKHIVFQMLSSDYSLSWKRKK